MDYALIGCGRVARHHIAAARQNGLCVTAVCDTREAAAERLAAELPGCRRYEDYRELLRLEKPELVAVATPSGLHAPIALDCIDRGIPVIIEKPMALSTADAREIANRSRRAGVPVAVCHQNRFNDAVRELRRAVDEGRFGRISHGTVQVRWHRPDAYYSQSGWRGTWAQDGGALMNQCIHGVDLLRWMLGKVCAVRGATARRLHRIEAEDVGLALLEFESGALGLVEGTTNVYPRNMEQTLCIFGERGTVRLGGVNANCVDIWEFADAREEDAAVRSLRESACNEYGNGHARLYADMLGAMSAGRNPLVGPREGYEAVELVLAAYLGQKSGGRVTLPLGRFGCRQMMGVL